MKKVNHGKYDRKKGQNREESEKDERHEIKEGHEEREREEDYKRKTGNKYIASAINKITWAIQKIG